VPDGREPEADLFCDRGQPLRLAAFLPQQPERQVDPFDLAEPAFSGRVPLPMLEVGFELVEPEQHLRADVEHGQQMQDVLVGAGAAVGRPQEPNSTLHYRSAPRTRSTPPRWPGDRGTLSGRHLKVVP